MFHVAVRALCEFTAKTGDLNLRFTPAPSAQEGIEGHQLVAARRGSHYQAELPLSGDYGELRVRGRADGYDPHQNQLEEVKTHRGDLSLMPDNQRQLHWAQVKVYGWLLCQAQGLAEIRLALVYFNVLSQRETLLVASFPADELRAFFEQQCERFLTWAEQELAHRAARDQALRELSFPHADFRQGQRPLAEAVYKAVRRGQCLVAEAPTGIGKTLATLFPALKAMPDQALDNLFFLSAKTPGRRLALEAIDSLRAQTPGLPLRLLELVARDKACEHPDLVCQGDICPLAKGFYDRLPAARQAAIAQPQLDQARLREIALAHAVCPYYLSQELARWSDVIVGDYNYYFDLGGLLYALTLTNQWQTAVLVDEAHNLVERARAMYSAELNLMDLMALIRSAPAPLTPALKRVQRSARSLIKDVVGDYAVLEAPPDSLLGALQNASAAITDYLSEHPLGGDGPLQTFYFEALHFCRLAELFDAHSIFDVRSLPSQGRSRRAIFCCRNIVPAPFLAPRLAAAQATVMFSATLRPPDFYDDLLGLPKPHARIEVESPFSAEQLKVRLVTHISTRYQHRQSSLTPIAGLIQSQYQNEPGNYLVFVSSFEYLDQLVTCLRERAPEIPVWQQDRGMTEAARQAFLDRFQASSTGIGFAVLGGAFGEGIDLPGTRLIGAFIATLGLPQLNPVNEQLKRRLDLLFGAGYDYTYFYPGLQKVIQAAGRVIRTPEDRGVVYLIDDRFARPAVLRLLPQWWRVERVTKVRETTTSPHVCPPSGRTLE